MKNSNTYLSIRYDYTNPITNENETEWFSPLHSGVQDSVEFEKIYKAKTFCSFNDLEKLRSLNLIKGGTENNAIIYNDNGILNPLMLEYRDKNFVKHKLLDFIGDISQLSANITGYIHVMNSGHTLNHIFCKKYIEAFNE